MAEEQCNAKVVLPEVNQIGIVVEDLDKAVQFYSTVFGWGPFYVVEAELKGVKYRGKPTTFKIKSATANSGQVQLSIVQILEGDTIHTELLRRKGEGLSHLCFFVTDLDDKIAELAKKGIKPIFSHKQPGLVRFAYLDTEKIGGVIIELLQWG